jgi:CRISPR-associated protein (TIGR03984 family)
MNSATLYAQAFEDISLEDAIAQSQSYFSHVLTIGLFYSPNQCCFGQWNTNAFYQSNQQHLNLSLVFEARIFNSDYELRWLNRANRIGQAVLLSESILPDDSPLSAIDTRQNTYYLWGEGVSSNNLSGWSILATARIGKLEVPLSGLQNNEKARLVTREYFQVCDDYGNVAIAEERILGLQRSKRKVK